MDATKTVCKYVGIEKSDMDPQHAELLKEVMALNKKMRDAGMQYLMFVWVNPAPGKEVNGQFGLKLHWTTLEQMFAAGHMMNDLMWESTEDAMQKLVLARSVTAGSVQ